MIDRGSLKSALVGITLGVVVAILTSTIPWARLPARDLETSVPHWGDGQETNPEIMVWRVTSPGSPEAKPWTHPRGETTVVILHRVGETASPTVFHPGIPPQLIIQQAVAIPPEKIGPPFRFNILLPRELPVATVLIHPREEVVECQVDAQFRSVEAGTAGARHFRRVTMIVLGHSQGESPESQGFHSSVRVL